MDFNVTCLPAHVQRSNVPYDLHLQGGVHQQQAHSGQLLNPQGQYASSTATGQPSSGSAFNMAGMFGALSEQQPKEMRVSPAELQRLSSIPSALPAGFPAQQIPSFAGQTTTNNQGYNPYPPQYSAPFQQIASTQAYPQAHIGHQTHSGGPNPIPSSYGGPQYFPLQNQQPYMYYPGNFGSFGGPQQSMQANPGPYASSYNRAPGFSYSQAPLTHPDGDSNTMGGKYPSYGGFAPGTSIPYGYNAAGSSFRPGRVPGKY